MNLTKTASGLGTASSRKNRLSVLTWAAVVCLLVNLMFGCTPASSTSEAAGQAEEHHHDHGHRPESYTAALKQIRSARDDVKAAFDAGTPKACDEALHVLAEVLVALPEVAAETDLPKEDWQVVKDQSKSLFDQFMKIHNGFHGDGEPGASFDSVETEVDAAIEILESKVSATGEKDADVADEQAHGDHDHGHDHDHDDHDHGDHDHGHDHDHDHS